LYPLSLHAALPIFADKGYHSNRTLIDLHALGVRPYIAEPDRGRRRWRDLPEAQALVYANRKRLRGARGGRLRRHRAEYVERSFAHLYETGAMRRTHLRGHQNILKRRLVHAGAFNLGLIMRLLTGAGPPRGLRARLAPFIALLAGLTDVRAARWPTPTTTTAAPAAKWVYLRGSLTEVAQA